MALLETEGLVGLFVLLFWAWAVIDVIATDSALIRNLDKVLWLLLVIMLPVLGALAWLLLGRPEGAGFMPGRNGSSPPAPPPEFPRNPPLGARSRPALSR